MKLKIILQILLLICFCLRGNSQAVSEQEKKNIQILLDSADDLRLKSPDHCLKIANKILSTLPVKGNENEYVHALLHAANSQKMLSEKADALDFASRAIIISNSVKDPELMIRSYFMKATIFGEYDDQDSSLVYYQNVIDIHRPGMDPYYVSSAYTNVGLVYSTIGSQQKAEEYLIKGYHLSSEDAYSKIFGLASLISYYAAQHNPKYLPYLDTMAASDFYKKASPTSFMAHFDSFLLLDDATDAEKVTTLREVYNYSLLHSSLVNQVGFGFRLYEQLEKTHKYNEAHTLLLELFHKSSESKNGVNLTAVVHALYENSKSRSDLNEALKYLELHSDLRDSLLSEENTNRIAELNIKFETAQKDHEIQEQGARLELVRRNRDFFILLAFMLTALAVVVFFFFRTRARTAQRITEQEKVIHQAETQRMLKDKEVAELTATLESQEKERHRIARDLHDGLGSMMSGISSQIEYLRSQSQIEEASRSHLVQLRELVKEATSELRRTSYELMPAKLLRQGLEPALRDLCLNLLVKNGVEPVMEINTDLNDLNPEQQLTLYRIIQELLNNIVKHAEAKKVFIQFSRFGEEISLVVEDDGKGFDVAMQIREGGLGLGSLSSRVNLLQGFLDIASIPGEGTTVTVNFSI